MSSSYNPSFSTSQLRQRKGFRPFDRISFLPTPSFDTPSISQENEQAHESLGFNLDFKKLANIVKDKNDDYLDEVGGVNGMAELLHTNMESGIPGDVRDLCCRQNAFGSNNYCVQNQPLRRVKKYFLSFYLRSSLSFAILHLVVPVFVLPITRDIVMSVIFTLLNVRCFMGGYERYRVAKEIEKLLDERDELRSNVVRDGQRLQIPAHEVVVGDVVMLKRGDQAPADGLSLGGGKKYYMDADLIEVEDTRMLVTSVGESTEYGQKINVASIQLHEMTRDPIMKPLLFLLQIQLKSPIRWFIKKKQNAMNNSESHPVEIVVQNDNDARFSGFDLEGLGELVMEKNYDAFSKQFGGVDSVVEALKSHRENGIIGDVSDLHQRIRLFGSNTFQLSHNRVFLQYLLKALFGNPCFPIWCSQALNLCIKFKTDGLKEWWSVGLAIYVLTLCIAIAQAERARHCHPSYKLKDYVKAQVEVVRSGRQKCISAFDVVVGDIVRLRKGSLVPADGLFLDGGYLQLEGMSAQINQENPFMLFGGKVSYGCACMLVTCVGKNSSWAKKITSVTGPGVGAKKPLQMNFKKSVSLKEKVDLISATIIPSILLVKNLFGRLPGNKDGSTEILLTLWATLMKYMFCVFTETNWVMPFFTDKHKKVLDPVLKKESSNIFDWITSGRVTTIVIDGKSMLMQKHMEVVEFRLNDDIINVSSCTPSDVLEALHIGLGLQSSNSTSVVSPTDETLFSWGELELGINKTELMSTYTTETCVSTDEDKLTWTLIKKENNGRRARYLHCRGDALKLLSKCFYYHEKDGAKKSLNEVGKREKMKQVIGDMQANGLTCVALAHNCITEGSGLNKENQVIEDNGGGSSGELECIEDDGITSSEEPEVEEDIIGRIRREVIDVEENGLTLIGLVGIRHDMRKSVESLQKMGVKVKMVWLGDDRSNAVELARVCGIVAPTQNEDEVIVEAEAFRNCSDEEEKGELVKKMCVMVRSSSPMEKTQLVEYLKKNNEVVAVVGSREDDARVLQEADIGFSMQSGSVEAVKEMADFLILDDSFTSIVTTLKMMRRYYFNFITFTKIQLGVIFPVFILNFAAAIISGETPISDFMLFCMDTYIAILFVWLTDDQSVIREEELLKLPSGRNEVMIPIKVMYVIRVLLVTLILLVVNFLDGDTLLGVKKKLIMVMSLYLIQIIPWKIVCYVCSTPCIGKIKSILFYTFGVHWQTIHTLCTSSFKLLRELEYLTKIISTIDLPNFTVPFLHI